MKKYEKIVIVESFNSSNASSVDRLQTEESYKMGGINKCV